MEGVFQLQGDGGVEGGVQPYDLHLQSVSFFSFAQFVSFSPGGGLVGFFYVRKEKLTLKRCYRQFCYVCGDVWKSCDCPQFSARAVREYQDRLPQRQRQVLRDEALARQLEFEMQAVEQLLMAFQHQMGIGHHVFFQPLPQH